MLPDHPPDLYDNSTVTLVDRTRCAVFGHDVPQWGTIGGWCHRCKHTVLTNDRRRVLYYGEFRWFPPRHDSA